MKSKVFISYHRKDTESKDRIIEILENKNIKYYVVPENYNCNGKSHHTIADDIRKNIEQCKSTICIVGKETYSRAHVDWELHKTLKGNVGTRRGLVTIMLESRGDSKNNIDYNTFPNRIQDNENYTVIEQYASIDAKIVDALEESIKRSRNKRYNIDNKRKVMQLRNGKYYEQ